MLSAHTTPNDTVYNAGLVITSSTMYMHASLRMYRALRDASAGRKHGPPTAAVWYACNLHTVTIINHVCPVNLGVRENVRGVGGEWVQASADRVGGHSGEGILPLGYSWVTSR